MPSIVHDGYLETLRQTQHIYRRTQVLKNEKYTNIDFENCKYAAQFPFPQLQNTSVVPNATPLIDFDLIMLATGRVEPTIGISVVTQPSNFPLFNRVIC